MQSRSQSSSANSDVKTTVNLALDSSNWPGDEAGGYVELHCGSVFGDEL